MFTVVQWNATDNEFVKTLYVNWIKDTYTTSAKAERS